MTYTFAFDHAHDREPRLLRDLLGGKGANLAEMTMALDLPVPPGFTVTTEACRCRLQGHPVDLGEELSEQVARLEALLGRSFGSSEDPLLLSVRSGAPVSMPGMMDTVLDLGLSPASVEGLASATGDRRFAMDSYRRFVAQFASVVLGVDGRLFADRLEVAKRETGVSVDADLPSETLALLADEFRAIVATETGNPFPDDAVEQLDLAVEAVFESWQTPRAAAYRRREHIADDLGTAVNVQAMVFGNRDADSGTGVGFTRDPSTGENQPYGDFLVNAQGEDVVSGIRDTEPLASMGDHFPEAYQQLLDIFHRLEVHYRDMLDTEFTVEQGKLWMLQVRSGKRSGRAALRIAVDLAEDTEIGLSHEEALMLVEPDHLDQVLHPQMDRGDRPVLTTGLAASPGAGVGGVYFTADEAVLAADRGEAVVLVRRETSPEDVHGIEVAEGILTSRGGLVSHAAVVARGWGKPAVVGASELHIGEDSFRVGTTEVGTGDVISVDGTTGEVILGEVPLTDSGMPEEFGLVLRWADEVRGDRFKVRANADVGPDAEHARELGAEGIGLCRTEHMFLGDRLPVVRKMILADSPDDETAALAELLDVQRGDFIELLAAMDGLPVTVRLLDPPLHEFLPNVDEIAERESGGALDEATRKLFAAARKWREVNPMLGTRGVRLGIVKHGLYRMQVRALAEAVLSRREAGGDPRPQVMVPLVVTAAELELVRSWVAAELTAVLGDDAATVGIGTMIETPRAALRADDIAEFADFFSFGTNDLTQMTFGFSRDDVERRLMPRYLRDGLLQRNPFESIDHRGVGELVATAVKRGREVRADLELGVCGEHGGDPLSIEFFASVGLDYVSCSPFRVPVARLAGAQALLRAAERG